LGILQKASSADKVGIPNHASGRSDNLPGQENVFQPECFDLLSVFRSPCEVNPEQQKQTVVNFV
jgi:hypothetical protein